MKFKHIPLYLLNLLLLLRKFHQTAVEYAGLGERRAKFIQLIRLKNGGDQ